MTVGMAYASATPSTVGTYLSKRLLLLICPYAEQE